MTIQNVIICGLGALGLTYANKLNSICNLKILANKERIEKYKKNPPKLNNQNVFLNYITPEENFCADLIIITTKSTGLNSAIEYLKNFASQNTIIISLINGISSEEILKKHYPNSKIIRSFFIGHSAIGMNTDGEKKYFQDGVGKIVFEPNKNLENFFKKNNIDHEISNDIIRSQWIKLGVNIILNEPSAIYECTVGELRKRKDYFELAHSLLKEIKEIAQASGIKNIENYEKEVLAFANLIADDGKTSMYQDILAKRKTEVDIFSGEIIKLGEKYNIKTPNNEYMYKSIKSKDQDFS